MKIDLAEARKMMLRAIEEKGADHVYVPGDAGDAGTCFNYRMVDGVKVPDCIVGHGLNYWGLPDLVHPTDGVYLVFDALVKTRPDFEYTAAAEFYLAACQSYQDDGYTWGESEKAAWNEIQEEIAAGEFDANEMRVGI